MCGIVGIVSALGRVQEREIDAMNRAILHRGPDGAGARCEGNVGIGMRRLSIIDLEGGDQPIANEDGSIHVVQNGEIYNFRELRDELRKRGHQFRTHSDTEVIVHAYEEWGGFEFATHLRGMFAAAVWDTRERTLWITRDRLGQKPLYYARSEAGIVFASEARALVQSGLIKPELEPEFLAEYLTFGCADVDRSALKHVRQLLPGCTLRVSTHDQQVEIRRYWRLEASDENHGLDEKCAIEAVYEALDETVRTHLVSDVPVGAFLSGGVDSSAVVGMMAKAGVTKLQTFSIGFDEERFNELPYAREVAQKWGCDHHEEVVRPDAFQAVEEIVARMDEPFADASAIPTWYVSKLAAGHVKVVLSGDGGDELFAGYDRYAVAAGRLYLDRIPRALRSVGASFARLSPSAMPGKHFLEYAELDAAARYASEHCLFPPAMQRALLRREYTPDHLGFEAPLDRSAAFFRDLPPKRYLARCMMFDTLRYLPMDILAKVDRMTMAHGLEARPPLLDHRFVEFAWSLPLHMKFRSATARKYILRKAMGRVVPQHLLDRKKSGFSVPLRDWFAAPLRETFCDTVLDPKSRIAGFLDPSAVRQLFHENRSGRRDHGLRLWALLGLELWLRQMETRQVD